MGEFFSLFFLILIGVQGSVHPLQQIQGPSLILSYCLFLISFVDLFNAVVAGMSDSLPLPTVECSLQSWPISSDGSCGYMVKDYLKTKGIMTVLSIGIAVILMYLFTG